MDSNDSLLIYFYDVLMPYLNNSTELHKLGDNIYEFANIKLKLVIIISCYIKDNKTFYMIEDNNINDVNDLYEMDVLELLAYLNSQLLDASYLNIIKSTASTDINIINSKPPSQA